MQSLIPLSLFLTLLQLSSSYITPASAVRFPFTVRHNARAVNNNGLVKRGNGSIPLTNNMNAQYIANLSLASTDVRVLLDTGRCIGWRFVLFCCIV
jgi:hypothetical protein